MLGFYIYEFLVIVMLMLYPPIKPFKEHSLKVDDIHVLHIEESGNPDGQPVIFLHGGPGGGCTEDHRRFFPPDVYRIILFDQRGSGKSTPHAELKNNTTQDLISDIEKIKGYLKLDSFILFGGSWGSTLALCYAIKNPQDVQAMILRGVFLCRKQDIHWFYQNGASHIFPQEFEEFKNHIPSYKRDNLLKAYYDILIGDDEVAKMAAAKVWSGWEAACSTLEKNEKNERDFTEPHVALSMARIETHYFINNIFLKENYILDNIDKIRDIPGIIVHGRYDMVCPLDNATALNDAWPKSELQIVRTAGHSTKEPGIVNALVHAVNQLIS